MEYAKYYNETQAASKLVDEGRFEEALHAFDALVNSDISDLDKALMCYNMTIIYDKMGRADDALAWFDAGIAYEQPYYRCFVSEHKAVFLSAQGREAEAIEIYESLYPQPFLTESEKERIWNNIVLLKNRRK